MEKLNRHYRDIGETEETTNKHIEETIGEPMLINLDEFPSIFEIGGGGSGYRNVLDRYYVPYSGPHHETVYQHSNG
jgi:hypothetical protein